MRINVLLALSTALGACSTIQFSENDTYTEQANSEKWHHDGIFGLVEFSDPVNLKGMCGDKKMETFTSEKSFLQGLIAGITYSLYTPMQAAVTCK